MTTLKRFHTCTATVCAPDPAAGHHQPRLFLETSGHPQASLLWDHCSFLLGPGAQGSAVPSKNQFSILCKFWQLYGGVHGDLLQEDLCHIHSQSLCPPPQEVLKDSSVSVSVESLGPGVHKVCLSPLSISGGNGVWFWMWFHPSWHLRSCKSHAVTIKLSSGFWLSLGYTKERIALVTNGSTVSHPLALPRVLWSWQCTLGNLRHPSAPEGCVVLSKMHCFMSQEFGQQIETTLGFPGG